MKKKVEIKNLSGEIIYEYEAENNTLKKTVEKAVKEKVDLRGADLRNSDLSGSDLRNSDLSGSDLSRSKLIDCDLRGSDLRYSDLSGSDLSGSDLRYSDLSGSDLRYSDLSGSKLIDCDLRGSELRGVKSIEDLPQSFINLCSRDMLFVFNHLKTELPFLKDKLLKGEVEGTQYKGRCACLIGTAAKSLKKKGDNVEKICKKIPYYNKGVHNMGETWFLSIHKGDTPKNSKFAAHAVKLIDEVLTQGEK